ncbi:unnamed protein product [Adineta steineri]|uniref:ABC transporter domain-containing protein n=2 Tax=Adineta steineri TaxID=433720 RepID=A0A814TMT1_9BILA|nr:unnamed protein product [Adineta steineri]
MGVCRQIRLILWKNFTIRRRRWPRVIFELIWPLFLFFILMWVRTRNLTFYYDACYNDPKYLGATGFLPALQSYICQWNNTCYNQSKTTDEFHGDASFWNQLTDLSESLSIIFNDDKTVNLFDKLFTQINSLQRYSTIWNGTILANKSTNDFNQSIPTTIINTLFQNPVGLSNLHQSWFMNHTKRSESNLNIIIQISYSRSQKNFSFSYQSETNIKQSFCNKTEFNKTFLINSPDAIVPKNFLCNNLSATDLKLFLISVQNQLDDILLTNMAPDIVKLTMNGMQAARTLEQIHSRLNILNVSFSFNETNSSISLTSLCGGRNDLSQFFTINQSSNNQSNQSETTQNKQTETTQTRSTADDTLTMFNYNRLAENLLSYDESEICQESYITGSGKIMQFSTVNRTCRCALFDQVFNSNTILRQFATLLRPILYGKIYYHPSNIHYDNIIKNINQTFESLDELVRLLRQIESTSQTINDIIPVLCNSFSNSSLICQQFTTYQTSMNLFIVLTEFLACTERNRFIAMDSELDMVYAGQNDSVTNSFLAAIEFMDTIGDNDSLPTHIRFKIRMALDYVDNTFQTADKYFSYAPRVSAPISTKYHSYLFIYLQNALERAIIYAQTGRNISYGIQTQQMPYPCWINDKFSNAISRMLPLFMVLSWIFTVSMNVKDIVHEKEKRLKEIMRIMGLNDSVHWFTWFILCTATMLLIAFFLILLLKFGKITQFSSFSVLLVFFISYTVATITQCFLISVLFNRANLAACGAGIIYFVLYLPYTILISYDTQVKIWQKAVACLSSTVAFGVGCDYIARFEGMVEGIQWSNINRGVKPNDNFTFLYCIIMMLIDSVIYMLLTIYIENVFPGEYGIPQVWYYPFTKTYWFGYNAENIRQRTEQMKCDILGENDIGELGISIENVSKYFGNKMALKNLSVKFYRNMITAFLGRNGAGKSTTWSILTGLIPPTSGTIYIDGYDILTDIKIVRKRLGFAPQYNILFDLLTVKEHLEFFSALKDAPKESIETEIHKMLNDLALEKKADNYSTELSGGMKRKLSIAIAFVGNSTTVILDEPTAGVDPFARRAIWDLVLKYKPGRTIVLSTHHLDEADLLSDRLAIISSGELQCVGTPMYLKRKYGEGYNLIIELASSSDDSVLRPIINKNSSINSLRFLKLTDFLRQFIVDICVKEQHGDQITYILIDDAKHTKYFPKMLAELDANKKKYQIKSYGLSNSSLEQVFLRVANEIKRPEDYERLSWWKKFQNRFKKSDKKVEEQTQKLDDTSNDNDNDDDDQLETNTGLSNEWSPYTVERYTGIHRTFIQIKGLLIKRFHRTKRNIKGLIAEILLPIIFILLAMLVTTLSPNTDTPPMLILHPWYWSNPNYIFQSLSNNNASNISQTIQQTFTKPPSLGTRCIPSTMLNQKLYPCSKTNTTHVNVTTSYDIMNALNQVNYNETCISPECDCWQKMQTCPIGSGGPSANYDIIETKDILYDLQEFNISDWIVKTEYNLEYLMKRFGGFEFLLRYMPNDVQLVNERLINQIINITNPKNQSSLSTIDATKIAPLFRIFPPQASIWYNNKGWPASVAFLNVFNNALLRGLLLQNNSTMSVDNYGITAINHPLPQSQIEIDSDALQSLAAIQLFTAICVIFALAFIPASFLVFLIDERITTSKHLQFVSGVKGITYWWGNFLWDLTNYCISIAFCVIIFLAFDIQSYVSGSNLLCLVLLLFLYGFAIIPLMYPINYFFQTPSTGFVLISCINIFIGIITTISTFTLDSFDDEPDLVRVNNILKKLFLIFPHYCLGRGLFDMSITYQTNAISTKYIIGYVSTSPFQMNIVGQNLLALFLQGIIFFIFTILVQYRFFIPDRGCIHMSTNIKSSNEDNDVATERERIYNDSNNTSNDILRMVDLVKIYGWLFGKQFTAVKQTCVGIKQGECFGLLGINGSGKSTTFKMLTGEISMTDGNAYINNYSVIKQLDKVRENIGYCPQFDALDSLLTAREHLYFYARLRGIKEKNISFIADCLLKRLGLTLWADRPVKHYSGGNKRKLSTAISIIGNPSIIFMDEPTTGMDVRAKRFLWNCILTLTRQDQKSVIITSHSMEECETLCNRLVIMVSGEFKCLGSVQHLKEKFGDGYTILVRTNIDVKRKDIIDYIQQYLPEAIVKEVHNKMIHFRVSTNVPLYKMFSILEKAREELLNLIEDYTISQVTLDDVFVNFAKMQQDDQIIEQISNQENHYELMHRTNRIEPT